MRVLQVNDFRESGGAEVLVRTTMALLEQRGVETSLFTPDDVPGHRRTPLSYVEGAAVRRTLRRVIESERPDVVHFHNIYHRLSPACLDAARGTRVVMTAHDYHLVCPNSGFCAYPGGRREVVDPGRVGRVGYLLSRRWDERTWSHGAMKLAQHVWNYRIRDRRRAIDRLICPSRVLEGLMRSAGLPAVFVPYPIPPAPAANGHRPDVLRLVFAGRVEPEKGLAPFLAALPRDLDAEVLVVGDGSDVERSRAVARDAGLAERVRFVGTKSREETMKLIAASHAMLLPSLVYENCPLSLCEALAVGTNIVTCDRGGMREVVESSGVGFMFSPEEPGSVRAAMERVRGAFLDGTLNRFDASAFLDDRSETRYVERLMEVYEG